MKTARSDIGIGGLIVAANLLIVAPRLAMDLGPAPWNNDYFYCAIARIFREHPFGWNPLYYCGIPFAYTYPPLFHALVALVPLSIGHSYHLISAIGYALVPAAAYALALALFDSRWTALFVAVACSVFPSPLYVFPLWANMSHGFAPWPFIALTVHEESPHLMAVAAALFALAAAWRGRWKLAACCVAAVMLLNWVGVIGLAPALVAIAIAQRRIWRVAAIAGAGYALAAFWITPAFLRSTQLLGSVILRYEMFRKPWSAATWISIAVGLLLVAIALWKRTPPVAAFLLAWVGLSGIPVAAFSLGGDALFPTPNRNVIEFNLAMILAVAACVNWKRPITVAALVLGTIASLGFLRHAYAMQPGSTESPAHQIADWLAHHSKGERVFVAGELEVALNVWTDVPQAGGGRQGITNFMVPAAMREVEATASPQVAELWLRALNTPYVVVHGAESREHFHMFSHPENFATLPVAWSNGQDDTVYRLPGDFPDSVVVDTRQLARIPTPRSTHDLDFLTAYVAWAHGVGPVEGDAILVKRNYDPGWGKSARPDPIGFLLVNAPPKYGMSFALPSFAGANLAEQTFRTVRPPMISPGGIVVSPDHTALSIYGEPFGGIVRAWVGDRLATILYQSYNQVNVAIPATTSSRADVSLEVNGVHGNSFTVTIK